MSSQSLKSKIVTPKFEFINVNTFYIVTHYATKS